MQLCIEVSNVQHISSLRIELDLNRNGLTCIVGKNGVGKTTLIKSIRNLKVADTFSKMAQPGAIKPGSKISYICDGESYDFEYDKDLEDLNSRAVFPASLKKQIEVEMPMPWGQRFNTFQSISSADSDIRTAVMLEEYFTPTQLILLLADVYGDSKFSSLKEVRVGKNIYYVMPLGDDRYVREDHLSSGEFFLISLYRKIKGTSRLIVIDEIDISLDAAAQSRLVGWLRKFCAEEKVNIVFTTHSMAIMRTMEDDELHYMYSEGGVIKTRLTSYNYIKSLLFGFSGWDRYILTEDPMLEGFFKFLISAHGISNFYSFQIIPVGGGDNVVQLLRKNSIEGFFGSEDSVIAILDGDYAGTRNERQINTFCIPFSSIEKKVFEDYQSGKYSLVRPLDMEPGNNKQFRKAIKKVFGISDLDLYIYLNENYPDEVAVICRILEGFLSRRDF
ncbi:ATP-dependent nuclease [Pseudomonas umsongensis]|uniref:ATP-dependent nuclease n=1 Tax=Pseudomonas umsongensis TaxID=198618 RepID=UPI00200AAE1A|nr:AAA family ATPase [Pseudomonas umsongensis]MCK8687915.1 ATP-binding protein [Pseudomonas umsongensis]